MNMKRLIKVLLFNMLCLASSFMGAGISAQCNSPTNIERVWEFKYAENTICITLERTCVEEGAYTDSAIRCIMKK